jgi:hypothetical protein
MAQSSDETATASPLTAARRHCLDCCGGSSNEVALCPARACLLWTMRFGKRPNPAEHMGDATQLYPHERPLTLGAFATEGMSTLAAMRRRCIDCSSGSAQEAKGCTHTGCDLRPFRLGRNPNRAGLGRKDGLFARKALLTGLSGRTERRRVLRYPSRVARPPGRREQGDMSIAAGATAKQTARTGEKAGRFKPGAEWTGNRAGRPKGSNDKLSKAFVAALADDFAKHGMAVIAKVRQKSPAIYLRIVADLVPKDFNLKHGMHEEALEALRALA